MFYISKFCRLTLVLGGKIWVDRFALCKTFDIMKLWLSINPPRQKNNAERMSRLCNCLAIVFFLSFCVSIHIPFMSSFLFIVLLCLFYCLSIENVCWPTINFRQYLLLFIKLPDPLSLGSNLWQEQSWHWFGANVKMASIGRRYTPPNYKRVNRK